jgi:hypothetical protein
MRFFPCWALFALLVCTAAAGPLERDLGLGLAYRRVHVLPADLPSAGSVRNHPCVLDIRYVHGNAEAGNLLLAWLRFHAGPHTPVFLLANAGTSSELLAPLDSPDAVAGLVILGAAGPDFTPDVALKVAPEAERRAYDALEKGASTDSLIVQEVDKPRIDEEKLNREHLSDSSIGDEEEGKPASPAPGPRPAPLIDVALQRAVQLHRALLAMRRL